MFLPNQKNRGFTLIELAIVLVIIGLLVGGVMVGQTLIRVATIRALISEKDKYVGAVMAFQTKYNGLPGDLKNATNFWGVQDPDPAVCMYSASTDEKTCNGDGDGIISYDNGAYTSPYEGFRLWQHLANAKMISGTYSGIGYGGSHYAYTAGLNAPRSRLGGTTMWGLWFLKGRLSQNWAPEKQGHYIVLGNAAGTVYNQRWHNPALPGEDTVSLDQKIDDGLPYMGLVNDMSNLAYSPTCTTSETFSTAQYRTDTDAMCIVFIRAF